MNIREQQKTRAGREVGMSDFAGASLHPGEANKNQHIFGVENVMGGNL